MRFGYTFVFLIFLIITGAAGCSTPSVSSNPPIVIPPTYGGNLSTVYGVGSGINLKASPPSSSDFKWKDSTGALHALADLKGKIVLVNFWATWCSNCVPELAELESISQEMRADSVVVIGVMTDQYLTFSSLQYNLKADKITYQNIADPEFRIYSNYNQVNGIPQSFLIDRDGIIQEFFNGAQSKKAYVDAITSIL